MRFKLGLPQNIFANMLASVLPREFFSYYYLTNSEILKGLVNGEIDLAIVPSLEILNENNLFVSSKIGIAFDGIVSDDYLYYKQNSLDSLKLVGSISLNEILLSKVLFKENYETDVRQEVLAEYDIENSAENVLVSGDENFRKNIYLHGDSFAEHVSDFLEAPYLKYILVAAHKENIEMAHQHLYAPESEIEIRFPVILKSLGFNDDVIAFVKQNFDGIYFELTEHEIDGYNEMRKLPFYYGFVEEVKEITFV